MRMLLFYFFASAMCSLTSSSLKQYHFINEPKTWFEAQKYCRENYADLATIGDPQDQDLMLSVKNRHGDAWIGLYDDISKWKWSFDMKDFNNNTDFNKWAVSNPNMLTYGHVCVVMTEDGLWHNRLCSATHVKICYNELGTSKYIVVPAPMTWEESRHYCRSAYTDLASVRNLSESNNVRKEIRTTSWIGLHRHSWANWSDQSPTTFTNWDTTQQTDSLILTDQFYCAFVDTITGLWYISPCNYYLPFFCHGTKPPGYTSRFKLRLKSDTSLNNAAVQSQILKQLHEKLEKEGIPDFKLRWIQTDGQPFDVEPKDKKKR